VHPLPPRPIIQHCARPCLTSPISLKTSTRFKWFIVVSVSKGKLLKNWLVTRIDESFPGVVSAQSGPDISQPKRDRVLDRLITMGVRNVDERYEPGMSTRGRSVPTSLEMHHASSIGSRLLSRIDILESEVRASNIFWWTLTNPFL